MNPKVAITTRSFGSTFETWPGILKILAGQNEFYPVAVVFGSSFSILVVMIFLNKRLKP